MIVRRRPYPRTPLAALAILAITVCGAAVAWACTPEANINATGPSGGNFGPAGSQMKAKGTGFVDGAKVEVRLTNRIGATVADLATARGPSFEVSVPVPSVPDGTYYVVATGPDPEAEGGIRQAPIEFSVGEPSPSSEPVPSPAPGPGAVPPTPSPGSGSPTASPSPEGTTVPGNTNGGDTPGRARGDTVIRGERTPPARGGDRGLDTVIRGEATRPGRVGATGRGEGVTTRLPSGQAVFADSLNEPRSAGVPGPGPATGSPAGTAPSEGSGGGDLWSGFSTGPGTGRAGLGGSPPTAESSGSSLVMGMALLGFGLAALLGSAGVAEARRRRRRAPAARR